MNLIEKSLKRKEVFYSEAPESKSSKTHEVKWVDFEEIQSDLISKLQNSDTFAQRVTKFCKYMDDPNEMKKLYITIDPETELCIALTIQKKNVFESEALPKCLFQEKKKSVTFIDIKLHESIQHGEEYEDSQFLHIRCSANGLLNELVKIEKGDRISGTKGMELFEMIVPWFSLRKVYLYDDAQIPYMNNDQKELYLSIRKSAIFRPDGMSWYEKKGFKLFKCENMPVLDQAVLLTQDETVYLEAKETVRMTRLSDLRQFIKPLPDVENRIITLQELYLPNMQADSTIYDLVSKIVFICQSQMETNQLLSAREDLSFFFAKCMFSWMPTDDNPNLQKYLKAIQVIEDARIYVKEYF